MSAPGAHSSKYGIWDTWRNHVPIIERFGKLSNQILLRGKRLSIAKNYLKPGSVFLKVAWESQSDDIPTKIIKKISDIVSKFFQATFKEALPGLRQFLATESLSKMMKNPFQFILKALFILKTFKFLSWFFTHI